MNAANANSDAPTGGAGPSAQRNVRVSRCYIDHIIVTAPSLEIGADFVRQTLGVAPQIGGEHPRMGTHNLLLRLGDSLFLEVISPNPNAPSPKRPRWFGLDSLRPDSMPTLAAWVARTVDIHSTASASSEALGDVEPMSRGALTWLITIPSDGAVPLNGVAPALIEWHAEIHPAARLQDRGLSLTKLEIFHPDPERVSRLLLSINFDGQLSVCPLSSGGAPYLVAHINTPLGPRELSAPIHY
jgi:hypothetical protein